MKNFVLISDDQLLCNYFINLSSNIDGIKFEKIFADTTSAMVWISHNDVNLVLVDMLLFNNDALVFAEKLHKNFDNIKIVLISDFITKNFREIAVSIGVNLVIPTRCSKDIFSKVIAINEIAENEKVDIEKYNKKKEKLIDERISNICISVGIPPNVLGYSYFREAIKITAKQPDIINKITKELYPYLAKKFNTTFAKVERALRHAMEIASSSGCLHRIDDILGVKFVADNKRLTSSEFIALVSDKIAFDFL